MSWIEGSPVAHCETQNSCKSDLLGKNWEKNENREREKKIKPQR